MVVTLLLTVKIKSEYMNHELDNVFSVAKEMAEGMKTKPGVLFYECFQLEAGKIEFIEHFVDSDAVLWHLRHPNHKILDEWFKMVELERCDVVGAATEELQQTIQSFPGLSKPIIRGNLISSFIIQK